MSNPIKIDEHQEKVLDELLLELGVCTPCTIAFFMNRAHDDCARSDGFFCRCDFDECGWPYGGWHYHEDCCNLKNGGDFCDCKASDANDTEWGLCH